MDDYRLLRQDARKVSRVLHSRRHLNTQGNCIPAAIAWCSGMLRETEIAHAASKKPAGVRSWRQCLAAAGKGAVAFD